MGGRIASQFIEVVANESTEQGRVASLFVEVPCTESAEQGVVAGLFAEVLATESTEKGVVASLFAEVLAKDTPKVRVAFVGAEVFGVPTALPAPVTEDVAGRRTNPFAYPQPSRRRRC